MLNDKDIRQISMEFVSIEELVPKDHLLRKIDKAIDFGYPGESQIENPAKKDGVCQ